MAQKKIIFTVTNDLTYDQRMQKICRSMVAAGYKVELVGRELSKSKPLTAEPFEQTRLSCFFNKGKLFYIEYNIRLFIYLLFTRFDAVCAIDLDTIVPLYYVSKLKGTKRAYDAHEYFTEVPEVIRRPKVQRVWQWVERNYVPKFDLIYTVSPTLAKLFAEHYGKEVGIVMNVPTLRDEGRRTRGEGNTSDNRQPTTGNYLLYQGALNEGRGLEHLIEAMQHIDSKLLLAGEGDLSSELRVLVKALNLENKVEFLGYVKPADLREITAKAYIGINLLENKGLSYYYSLSNKFFDYIHARVPQVCIGFPEYAVLNEKYNVALLTQDCSIHEIKAAVQRLLSDKDLYCTLQKNCEVCSRELNWQEEEKKLGAMYEQLFR